MPKAKMTDAERKEKRRLYAAKWRSKNPERSREINESSRARNIEKIRERDRARKNTPARMAARSKNRVPKRQRLSQEEKKLRQSASDASYRERHKEEVRERKRRYYFANKEKIAERVRIYHAKYYLANKTKLNSQAKNWASKNPAATQSISRRHNARRRAAPTGDINAINDWEMKWRSRKFVKCHWCRKRIASKKCHVDHVVPLAKGGVHALENLAVSCRSCNLTKHAKLPEVFNKSLNQPLLFV